MTLDEFSNEWIKGCEERLPRAYADDESIEVHWTEEYLIKLFIEGSYERLWDFVLTTYPKNLSELTFGYLAAGPLEDLLGGAGDNFIDRVEVLARKDERFRKLLSGVYQNAMSKRTWDRIRRASEGA